jgi:hypothetical protein
MRRHSMRQSMHPALRSPSNDGTQQGIENTKGKERTRLRIHIVICASVLSMFCTLPLSHSISESLPESIAIRSELWQPSRWLSDQSPVKTQNSTPFSRPASSPVDAFDIVNIDTPPRESLIPSNNSLQQFMQIPSDYDPDIQRMWTCSDPNASKHGRRKKLIFIHVFKTAGSTFRVLFAKYALQCHVGYACAVGCSGLSRESVTTKDKWANAFGSLSVYEYVSPS